MSRRILLAVASLAAVMAFAPAAFAGKPAPPPPPTLNVTCTNTLDLGSATGLTTVTYSGARIDEILYTWTLSDLVSTWTNDARFKKDPAGFHRVATAADAVSVDVQLLRRGTILAEQSVPCGPAA